MSMLDLLTLTNSLPCSTRGDNEFFPCRSMHLAMITLLGSCFKISNCVASTLEIDLHYTDLRTPPIAVIEDEHAVDIITVR